MAPRDKVTAEQKAFLCTLVDMYLETKKHGGWSKFWASTFQGWFKLWPEPEDTSIVDKEERDAKLAKAILCRHGNWFRNHAVRKAPTSLNRREKKSKRTRGPQLLELYSTEYYASRVATNVASTNEAESVEELKQLPIIRSETKKAFFDETPEFQAELAAKHQQILKNRAAERKEAKDAPKGPDTPQSYEAGITSIPIHFNVFAKEVEASGWSFVLLCGGPDPRNGGRISTTALHSGANLVGLSHSQYDPNFMAHHVPAFANFLTTCYTSDDCAARSFTSGSTNVAAKVSPLPTLSPPSTAVANDNPGSLPPSTVALSSNVSPASHPASPRPSVVPNTTNAQPSGPTDVTSERQSAIPTTSDDVPSSTTLGITANVAAGADIAAGGDTVMEFSWDGFDFSGHNLMLSMPVFNLSGGGTGGRGTGSEYPSLMQELTAPFPDLSLPTSSFPASNYLFPNAPNTFGAQDLSLSVPSSSIEAAPILQKEAIVTAPAQVDPALPIKASVAIADLPPPLQQVDPVLLTNPTPTVADAVSPVQQAHAGVRVPPPAASTPLNGGTNANHKRSRIDGLDERAIVDTKRARKSQKRTEVEAITHNPPRGKENRCIVIYQTCDIST
ncbi:hypothetical protein BDN71DRAFT_1521068 [Pleurotus eryngii]|uniref:Uncharacterized protein n=1 Tax=Pleurotus eryngii TaxID=5323 RepID=A0A9P5ZMQ7_PLEER|nr:hypothetical protein BDN71DRAFT_1521068 [Pleurotus eryngii]